MRRRFGFLKPLATLPAAALALGLSLPVPVRAAGIDPQPHDAACPNLALQVVAAALQLSPDQIQAWSGILANEAQAVGPLVVQIQQHQQAIAAQFGSGNPDPASVGQLFIEIHVLEGQVRAVQAQALAAFRGLLLPPQAQMLDQVREAARLAPIVPAFVAMGLVTDDLPAALQKRVGRKLPSRSNRLE